MKVPIPPGAKKAVVTFGVPGAANVLQLRGGAATRFAHIALHRTDLSFSGECLRLLDELDLTQDTVAAEALWRCAILHYAKCFAPPKARHGRSHIDSRRIYKGDPGALADHTMFLQIRNQQLAHDEGTHNFWTVGAVIEPAGAPQKIARLVAAQLEGVSLSVENVTKLRTLVERCTASAEAEFGELTDQIVGSLNAYSHDELLRHRAANMRFTHNKSRGARS